MHILLVTQYFWPEEFRINDLAVGLEESGHTITVLTGIPNYPVGRYFSGYGLFKRRVENYLGVKVIRVPLVPRGKGSIRLVLNYLSFAFFSSVLGPLYCRDNFDVIFVYEPSPITVGLPALVLKKIKSIPILFWVQDLWPESLSATGVVKSEIILTMVKKLVRYIYSHCDRILVQSKAFSPSIERLGVDSGHIRYFPNSAEELYKPIVVEPDAPEVKILPDGFRVMFAGNIGAAQDFTTILGAAEKLKDFAEIHWIIIGDGRMRPWVEAQISQRSLTETVHLLGRHPVELMPRFFSLADVMLVTLKKEPIFSLTIPAKVQSYLACAKPIIAALDGEGARIIEEAGAGIACPAENPAALAEGVLKFYHMPKPELHDMGMRGRRYFEHHFERTVLLERLNKWINEFQKGE